MLIRIIRPNYKAKQRAGEKKMLKKLEQEENARMRRKKSWKKKRDK